MLLDLGGDKEMKKSKITKKDQVQINPQSLGLRRRSEDPRLQKFAAQLVNPDAERTVAFPTLFPFEGTALTLKRVYTITSTGVGSHFAVILNPSLDNSLYVTGAVSQFPVNVGEFTGVGNPPAWGSGPNVKTSAFSLQLSDLTGESGVVHTKQQGVNQAFRINNPTGGALDVSVNMFNRGVNNTNCDVFVAINGGAYASPIITKVAPAAIGNQVITIAAGDYIYLGIAPSTNSYSISMSFQSGLEIDATNVVIPLVSQEWIPTSDLKKVRISAMSLLVSYTGSMLNNGGVIASARLQPNLGEIETNLYAAVAKLPTDSYHGPLKDGAYTWWLPRDLEEIDFNRDAKAFRPEWATSTKLICAGIFSEADSSVEVTVNMQVEFYSPLQIFPKRVFPLFDDSFGYLLRDMNLLPAACCNPSHWELLKKAASKGARITLSSIKAIQQFAAKNPEVVEAGLAALASLI